MVRVKRRWSRIRGLAIVGIFSMTCGSIGIITALVIWLVELCVVVRMEARTISVLLVVPAIPLGVRVPVCHCDSMKLGRRRWWCCAKL